MQLCSAYTFGYVANYARMQHFFYADGLLGTVEHGKDALLMYAGVLIWLCSVPFALAALAMGIRIIVTAQAIQLWRLTRRIWRWVFKPEGNQLDKCLGLQKTIRKQIRSGQQGTPAECAWVDTQGTTSTFNQDEDRYAGGWYKDDPLKHALEHQQEVLRNLTSLMSTKNYDRTTRYGLYKSETIRAQRITKRIHERERQEATSASSGTPRKTGPRLQNHRPQPRNRPFLFNTYTPLPTTTFPDTNRSARLKSVKDKSDFSVPPTTNEYLDQRREDLFKSTKVHSKQLTQHARN